MKAAGEILGKMFGDDIDDDGPDLIDSPPEQHGSPAPSHRGSPGASGPPVRIPGVDGDTIEIDFGPSKMGPASIPQADPRLLLLLPLMILVLAPVGA